MNLEGVKTPTKHIENIQGWDPHPTPPIGGGDPSLLYGAPIRSPELKDHLLLFCLKIVPANFCKLAKDNFHTKFRPTIFTQDKSQILHEMA